MFLCMANNPSWRERAEEYRETGLSVFNQQLNPNVEEQSMLRFLELPPTDEEVQEINWSKTVE